MISPTATLTIDLKALTDNYRIICDKLGSVESAAVVKANGYGVGAVEASRALAKAGCRKFFVATFDEAAELHEAGIKERFYVFHGCDEKNLSEFVRLGVTPVINDFHQLNLWNAASAELGKKLPAILHVDTGMNRLGFNVSDFHQAVDLLKNVAVEYVMSHLVASDEPENPINLNQLAAFKNALGLLPGAKASLSNSSGVFLGSEFHFNLARPGVALYGMNPTYEKINPMKQVVSLSAEIIQLREVDKDSSVSYSATCKVNKGASLATVGIGYADGLPWALANNFTGYINGIPVKLLGRVTMDLVVFDVSAVPEQLLKPGVEVEIFGRNSTVDDVADSIKTISYEILTRLGKRLKRVYKE